MAKRPLLVTRTATASTTSTETLNKGSKLSFAEMDSNFLELQAGTTGIVGDDSTGINIAHGDTLKFAGSGSVTTAVSGDTVTITGTGGDLVTDTSPQLGGNLDLNSQDITGTGNIAITGNIANDAVSITDNTIATTRSNDNLNITINYISAYNHVSKAEKNNSTINEKVKAGFINGLLISLKFIVELKAKSDIAINPAVSTAAF